MIRNYRGKSLGAWVFGDLVSRKGSLPPYIHFYDPNGCECMCDIEINTLGESTGEIDINDTTIYTGDIVKRTSGLVGDDYDGLKGVVKFIDAAYVIESLNGKDGTLLGDDIAELEVLGNIHDNPEMLVRQNVLCAGEDGICLFCMIGEDLEGDQVCKFDNQRTDKECPGFQCCEQCRECPKDCEFLG